MPEINPFDWLTEQASQSAQETAQRAVGLRTGETLDFTRPWEQLEPQFRQQFPGVDPAAARDTYHLTRTDRFRANLMEQSVQRAQGNASHQLQYFAERMPFSGTLNAPRQQQFADASMRVQNGSASVEDYRLVGEFVNHQRIMSDPNRGGLQQALDITSTLPAFGAEYAAGGMVGKPLGALATRFLGAGQAAQAIGGVANIGGRTAGSPWAIQRAVQERTAPQVQVAQDEQGRPAQVQIQSGRDVMEALPAGIVDTAIEQFTEGLGGTRAFKAIAALGGRAVGGLTRGAARRVGAETLLASMERGISRRLDRLTRSLPSRAAAEAAGIHGLIGEYGEERANDILRGSILPQLGDQNANYGIVGQLASGNIGNFLRQSMIEGLALGLYSGGGRLAGRIGNRQPSPGTPEYNAQRDVLTAYLGVVAQDTPDRLQEEQQRLQRQMDYFGVGEPLQPEQQPPAPAPAQAPVQPPSAPPVAPVVPEGQPVVQPPEPVPEGQPVAPEQPRTRTGLSPEDETRFGHVFGQLLTEGEEIPVTGFTTAQGSTYTWDGGRSQRNKAQRPGHADSGPKEMSDRTVFVEPRAAQEIGMWQGSSSSGRRLIFQGDEVILTSLNPKTGQRGIDGRFKFITTPLISLHPLEVWGRSEELKKQNLEGWRGNHPGSAITSLTHGPVKETVPGHSPDVTGQPLDATETKAGRTIRGFHVHPAEAQVEKLRGDWIRNESTHTDIDEPYSKYHDQKLAEWAARPEVPMPNNVPEVARAWSVVSRIIPEIASKVKKIEVRDKMGSKNARASINVSGTTLYVPKGKEVSAEYLWHEFVHLMQQRQGHAQRTDEEHIQQEREAYVRAARMQNAKVFDRMQKLIEQFAANPALADEVKKRAHQEQIREKMRQKTLEAEKKMQEERAAKEEQKNKIIKTTKLKVLRAQAALGVISEADLNTLIEETDMPSNEKIALRSSAAGMPFSEIAPLLTKPKGVKAADKPYTRQGVLPILKRGLESIGLPKTLIAQVLKNESLASITRAQETGHTEASTSATDLHTSKEVKPFKKRVSAIDKKMNELEKMASELIKNAEKMTAEERATLEREANKAQEYINNARRIQTDTEETEEHNAPGKEVVPGEGANREVPQQAPTPDAAASAEPAANGPVETAPPVAPAGEPGAGATRGAAESRGDTRELSTDWDNAGVPWHLWERFKEFVTNWFKRPTQHAMPAVVVTNDRAPRPAPAAEYLIMASNMQGMAKIPVLGKLVDPRASAHENYERALIAREALIVQGRSFAALEGVYQERHYKDLWKVGEDGSFPLTTGAKGYLADVIEREMKTPGSQDITQDQRNWIWREWVPLYNSIREMLRKEGVREINGAQIDRYFFPRQVLEKNEIQVSTGPKGARLYASEQEGVEGKPAPVTGKILKEGGTKYDPSFSSRITRFMSGMYRAIADKRLADEVKKTGTTVVERYRKLRQEHLASIQALKGQARRDLIEELKGIANHVAIGEARIDVPGFGGVIYPEKVAKRVLQHMGQTKTSKFAAWLEKPTAASKAATLALDIASWLQQGLGIMFTNPIAWARSAKTMFQAIVDTDALGKYLDNPENEIASRQYVHSMGNISRLQDFMSGLTSEGFWGRLPVIGIPFRAAGRAYGAMMDVAKIEKWKAERDQYDRTQWVALAESIEDALGSGKMEAIGLNPERMAAERFLALAPSYYRAGAANIARMFTKNGAAKVAVKSVFGMAAGVLITSIAGMLRAGLDWDEIEERLDPRRGKFLKVPVTLSDGSVIEVGFGHILLSYVRFGASLVERREHLTEAGVQNNPVIRFLRSKAALVPGLASDLATGQDFMGNPQSIMEAALRRVVPIAVQSIADTGDAKQRVANMTFSFMGLQSYSQNQSAQFFRQMNNEAKRRFNRPYSELSIRQQTLIAAQFEREGVRKPTATPQAVARAIANSAARQQSLMNGVSTASRQALMDVQHTLPSFDLSLHIGGATVPLSQRNAERYRDLLVEEYDRAIHAWPMSTLRNANPAVREAYVQRSLRSAKHRAELRLRQEDMGR